MIDKKTEETLLRLLKKYHHYRFMTGGFLGFLRGWFSGMSLGDFMQWLEGRED